MWAGLLTGPFFPFRLPGPLPSGSWTEAGLPHQVWARCKAGGPCRGRGASRSEQKPDAGGESRGAKQGVRQQHAGRRSRQTTRAEDGRLWHRGGPAAAFLGCLSAQLWRGRMPDPVWLLCVSKPVSEVKKVDLCSKANFFFTYDLRSTLIYQTDKKGAALVKEWVWDPHPI